MSKRGEFEYLADIIESVKRVESYVKDVTRKNFFQDTKTQDAVIRNIEVIGEAVRGLPAEFKRKHKEVEWARIAGMRNRLIHLYFGVDLDVVWDVVKNRLSGLRETIQDILAEREK